MEKIKASDLRTWAYSAKDGDSLHYYEGHIGAHRGRYKWVGDLADMANALHHIGAITMTHRCAAEKENGLIIWHYKAHRTSAQINSEELNLILKQRPWVQGRKGEQTSEEDKEAA